VCNDIFNDNVRSWLEEAKAGKVLRRHEECDDENWREEQGIA
jgi:hypothetical protein